MVHEENLYMITLYDLRCHPIADGVTWFFTDDIEDFQKRWTALEPNEDRIERFLQSKAGELVTDFYGMKDEDINIVQSDRATIYDEKFFSLGNIYFWITSATGIKTCLHADKINLHFKWLRFKENFMRIADIEVFGLTEHYNHKNKKNFFLAECYSNPVMERVGEKIFNDDDFSETPDFFAENSFKSICYLMDRFFKNEKELLRDTKKFIVTKRELDVLFDNFTGC